MGSGPTRPGAPPAPDGTDQPPENARAPRASPSLPERIRGLVRAIEDNDEARIEQAILRLSKSRRAFAPLALAVSAFVMVFGGLKLLVSNWRLTLVQILPAMWIWWAMFDLKEHALKGKSFAGLRGPILIPIGLVIVAITVACFFLNAVFAFAISRPGRPEVRPAVAQARQHLTSIAVPGAVVGVLLALATTVVTRWGKPWFTLALGIVIGVLIICYVAIPSRLLGVKPKQSRRDKLASVAVNGTLSAIVCTPPYLIGRGGILILASSQTLIQILGFLLLTLGVTLQAGATGSVRAIKMSATLAAASRHNHPSAAAS